MRDGLIGTRAGTRCLLPRVLDGKCPPYSTAHCGGDDDHCQGYTEEEGCPPKSKYRPLALLGRILIIGWGLLGRHFEARLDRSI